MSLIQTQMNINTPVDIGMVLQCPILPLTMNLATSINGSASVTSQVILTNGMKNFSFGITSSQAGSVSIQRYLDQAGLIPVGAAITASLVANTAAYADSVDSIPYQSMVISVSNSSGSSATISNCLLLLQAN